MNLISVWRGLLSIALFVTFFVFFGFSTIAKYLKKDVQVKDIILMFEDQLFF